MNIRRNLLASVAALSIASPAAAQITSGGSFTAGGTANQIQYNGAGGQFAGFTMSGDCTIVVSTGVITCPNPSLLASANSWALTQTFPAPGASLGSIVLTPGTISGTPPDGSLWTTTAGLFGRINGSTIGPFVTGTGSGCAPCATAQTVSASGAASTPASIWTGTAFAGTGTTSFPMVLIQPTTATASTTWGVNGSLFGINAHTGISNIFDFQTDGTSRMSLTAGGTVTIASNLTLGSALQLVALYESHTAPTLTGTGLGTSPTITANGTGAGSITTGSSPANASFTITLPTAAHGWACTVNDETSNSSNVIGQISHSTTTAVEQAYSRTTGLAQALTASDVLTYQCAGY